MEFYLNLIRRTLTEGTFISTTVQGSPCLRFTKAPQIEIDFSYGHPIVTTRSLRGSFLAIKAEILWIISGSCSVEDLHGYGVKLWDKWNGPNTRKEPEFQRPKDYLGPIYGHQLRNFGATRRSDGTYENDGEDQLIALLENINPNPYDRRNCIDLWSAKDVPFSFIAPCWGKFHFLVEPGKKLWIKNHQRSCDLFIGGAFDPVTHSILFELIARHTGYTVKGYTWSFDDLHIYLIQIAKLLDLFYPESPGSEKGQIDQMLLEWASNPTRTIEQLDELQRKSRLPVSERQGNRLANMLAREPRPLPRIEIHPDITNMFEFQPHDIMISGYRPHPPINDIPALL